MLNFIDVFSGAGGLSCGLELAGHKCLLGIDFDSHASETFNRNHANANVFCGDVGKLTKKQLLNFIGKHKVHAIIGGPPCQGFSTAGQGNPMDQRNSLFLEFVRIVKIIKPEFIIIENVTGLVAKKNEKTLKAILKRFSSIGYNLDFQIMSAHHYGVPEKRRRTIIIGSRVNETIIFPKKDHDAVVRKNYIPPVTVGDVLHDIKTSEGIIHNHDLERAKIKSSMDKKRLMRIPEGKGIRYERDEKDYLTKSLRLGVDWENLRENRFRQTKYQRLDRSKPSPTIMTCRYSYYHPTEPRYLSQREAAKLQSFPNDFQFYGPISAQWKQIGNAVPPLLGKALGHTLSKMYKKSKKIKKRLSKNTALSKISTVREKAFVYARN